MKRCIDNKVGTILILCLMALYLPVRANQIDSLELQLSHANDTLKTKLLIQLSKAYWTVSPSKGLLYANEAVKFSEQQQNQNSKAKALLYGGVNAWFMGEYSEAINYYQKSLSLSREIHNDRLCAYNLNNLGMVNTYLKNYGKAIENYTESSLIMGKIGDTIEAAKIKNNIAELNMLNGDLDLALKTHLSVLKTIEPSDEKVFLIWLYDDIGTVYKKKNEHPMALKYFFKSVELSQRIDNNLGKTKTMNHIGEIYLLTGDYTKAKTFFFDGLHYARLTDAKENINETFRNISEYFSLTGDYKQALDYYKKYKQLSDSIMDDNKIRTITEMQARYELEGKEIENKLLRKNVEIGELKIKKNKTQGLFLIALLLLTALLAIIIYSRLMIKKRKNDELNEKNRLINTQKDQLSHTLAELTTLNKLLYQQKKAIETSKIELETLNAKLAETNSTKDKFFTIIAHDLKGPFNTMLGFSEILEEEFENLEMDEKKRWIKSIHKGLQETFNLLENLLQWASTQRGTISFEPQETDLSVLTENTCKLLNQQALDKSISLINKITENTTIYADYNMISTVIRNLVTNAIKFTGKGGEVFIESGLTPDKKQVEIRVRDTGCGIPKEIQTRLFSLAGNKSTPGTLNEKGTGLGLILCKEFVEKHHGKIWIESEPGKGSSFIFTIPGNG